MKDEYNLKWSQNFLPEEKRMCFILWIVIRKAASPMLKKRITEDTVDT